MLRVAGFDARAYMDWHSQIFLINTSIAFLVVDNHMICTVVLGGKHYFLDGTEDNIAFNDYVHGVES